MASETSKAGAEKRIRTTALRHALDIEQRKKLQARITDLVIEAYDLPSKPDADPAHPQPSDAAHFKQCLAMFQMSELDDLIYERNVDNRYGYAPCPRANQKVLHSGRLVWNKKGGKDFKLVDKTELEKWCSDECQSRTIFVRAQLGTEPAWLREDKAVNVRLVEEVGTTENLAESLHVSNVASWPCCVLITLTNWQDLRRLPSRASLRPRSLTQLGVVPLHRCRRSNGRKVTHACT